MGRYSFKTFLFKLSFLKVISVIYDVNKTYKKTIFYSWYQVDCLPFTSNLRKMHVYYAGQCYIVQFLLNNEENEDRLWQAAKNCPRFCFVFLNPQINLNTRIEKTPIYSKYKYSQFIVPMTLDGQQRYAIFCLP